MRDLLPILIILACPIMMIFMMRGMRTGRDKPEPGRGPQAGNYGSHSPDGPGPDPRIAQLEREVASLRTVQGAQPEQRRVPRP